MQTNDIPTSIDGTEIPAPTPLPTSGPNTTDKDQGTADSHHSDNAAEAKPENDKADQSKRFIPEHKKPDSALTFPEKVSAVLLVL